MFPGALSSTLPMSAMAMCRSPEPRIAQSSRPPIRS